jgi:SAM-dependent methyltransferase
MPPKKSKPLAQDAYDALAEAYAERIDTKAYNAYYERPATLSLLPDVHGKRVLDAGCGPGVYTEWLIDHGAEVLAVDGNPKMVRLAQQRLGDKARVRQANLEAPLDFLPAACFDIILSPLVLDYLRDWSAVFAEFHRLLKSPGWLVFSFGHPFTEFDIRRETSNYHQVELVDYTWTGFGLRINMPSYRRPLAEVVNPLLAAGFILDKLLEPLPTEEFKQADPEDYEKLMRNPGFMCLRALKR